MTLGAEAPRLKAEGDPKVGQRAVLKLDGL